MSNNDIQAAARRVLEEVFPADDEAALDDAALMRQLTGDLNSPRPAKL